MQVCLEDHIINSRSICNQWSLIEDYLRHETEAGNILGPFPEHAFANLHINRFGVIPKKHKPGCWRLITDLSFHEGASVNDAIDPALCTLEYVTVNQVANATMQLDSGSLMAEIDIKSGYLLIPVHPRDRLLLGMQWRGNLYIDGMRPFGLRAWSSSSAGQARWPGLDTGLSQHYYIHTMVQASSTTRETTKINWVSFSLDE